VTIRHTLLYFRPHLLLITRVARIARIAASHCTRRMARSMRQMTPTITIILNFIYFGGTLSVRAGRRCLGVALLLPWRCLAVYGPPFGGTLSFSRGR
jgi:hypothetical protein